MGTDAIQELIRLLVEALLDRQRRVHAVRQFQERVWHPGTQEEREGDAWEVLRELAYDLDFYEPNPLMRRESASFFGDAQAEQEIREALDKLKAKGFEVSV